MELCLATRNKGKLQEISELLNGYKVTLRLISDFTDVEPVEDGGSYIANGTIKARAATTASGLPSMADDGGIEFDAMPNNFGVESSPFAASQGGWPQAMALVAARVAAGAPNIARHHVSFVLCMPNGEIKHAGAITPGKFVYPARGEGWGFNPYFLPDGSTLTYAEIVARHGVTAKNALSPRGRAIHELFKNILEPHNS